MPQKQIIKKAEEKPTKPGTGQIILVIVTIALQVAAGYGLFYLVRVLWVNAEITDMRGFITILVAMAGSFQLAAWVIGMLGVLLRKQKPAKPLARFLGTLGGAVVPVLILAYLGSTIGFADAKTFQSVVVGRMIPYYTNLTMVFSIAGFYLREWFSRVVKPKPAKPAKGR